MGVKANKKFHGNATNLYCPKAVSTNSLSSKYSGYSSMAPLREQSTIQARLVSKAERGDVVRAYQHKPVQKRGSRKLDFELVESTHVPAFNVKARPKRAWTLK